MFYAVLNSGFEDSPWLDLHRFKTKTERDSFVESFTHGAACTISAKEARESFKEQFKWWREEDKASK